MNQKLFFPILNAALHHFWRDKDHFLRLSVLPAILLLLVSIPLSDSIGAIFEAKEEIRQQIVLQQAPSLMGYSLIYILILSLFCTNWLRFIAFGGNSTGFLGTRLTFAHLRIALTAILAIVFQSTLLNLFILFLGKFVPLVFPLLLGLIVGLYCILRLSPYLVGLALDRRMTIAHSWKIARPYLFSLLGSVFLLQGGLFIGEEILLAILAWCGLVKAAPHGVYFLLSFFELARFAITFNLIFFYYRKMTELEVLA